MKNKQFFVFRHEQEMDTAVQYSRKDVAPSIHVLLDHLTGGYMDV